MLGTGCRPGEALGLRWSDLENGSVTIRQAVTQDGEGKLILAEPKTEGSERTIPLPRRVLDALDTHRKAQAEHILKLGGAYRRELNLVFPNEVGCPMSAKNLRNRYYLPLCDAAGIEGARGPYDLRHTVVSHLLSMGENVKVVSEGVGHASAAMTLDRYAHCLPGDQESATEKLEALLSG